MKTKLAITAVTTLAFANIASADKLEWDQKALDELLSHEKLVKNYGTVGYPLADELDPGHSCEKSTILYELNVPLYKQEVAGVPFTAGVGGELALIAEPTKVGAELKLGPTVELFGSTRMPVDVTFSALTHSDGTNGLTYSINALGFMVTTSPVALASSTTPITWTEQFGYMLPASALSNSIGDSYECFWPIDYVCERFSWEASAKTVGIIGGMVSFRAASDGIDAHAVLSSVANADVALTVNAYDSAGKPVIDPYYAAAHIDVMRLLFGARAQMLPQSGGSWVAGAASSLWLTNTMGALVEVDPPVLGKQTLFKLAPLDYQKEREFSCGFENKMEIKNTYEK
jgi:hypothetical protein